jgi:allophanate hydrolase
VVQRLLDAGACLVGKTNLDQFACGLNGTRSPYGAVPNAFNPDYVSGGSSSGSAYVVATGQVDFRAGHGHCGLGPGARGAEQSSWGSSPPRA